MGALISGWGMTQSGHSSDVRTTTPGVLVSFTYVNVTAGGSSEVFLFSAGFGSAKPSFLPLQC